MHVMTIDYSLAGVAQLFEYCLMHQEVTALIPSQGTSQSRRLNTQLQAQSSVGDLQESEDQCFSLIINFISLSLPLLLPKINKKVLRKTL